MRHCVAIALCLISATVGADERPSQSQRFPEVEQYLQARIAEFDTIPVGRKAQLQEIAGYVTKRVKAGEPARLTFICTHNSRRSHMSQVWAAIAARHYGIESVETFSGGTEATAFNPRAIATLQRAGLKIEKTDDNKNPHYAVRFEERTKPLDCFSKVYSDSPNPKADYCAVMTCSQADKSCPVVKGAALRMAIPFEDPKVADGTPEEAAKYDERCAQICREMLYLFSRVGK